MCGRDLGFWRRRDFALGVGYTSFVFLRNLTLGVRMSDNGMLMVIY